MKRGSGRLDGDGLYEKAVAALARRGRSEVEMRRLLRPRAASPAALEAVLERLREHRYLDDERLAATAAGYAREVFRHGARRAVRDLRARGVDAGVAERAVEEGYAGVDEDRLLRSYLLKKRCTRPADLRAAARLYRKLLLAGFTPACCQRALRAWKLDAEWLEALEQIPEPGDAPFETPAGEPEPEIRT